MREVTRVVPIRHYQKEWRQNCTFFRRDDADSTSFPRGNSATAWKIYALGKEFPKFAQAAVDTSKQRMERKSWPCLVIFPTRITSFLTTFRVSWMLRNKVWRRLTLELLSRNCRWRERFSGKARITIVAMHWTLFLPARAVYTLSTRKLIDGTSPQESGSKQNMIPWPDITDDGVARMEARGSEPWRRAIGPGCSRRVERGAQHFLQDVHPLFLSNRDKFWEDASPLRISSLGKPFMSTLSWMILCVPFEVRSMLT